MASWQEIEDNNPEFAATVKSRFDAGTNKTIATLRRDGSPRISGTELKFDAGEVTFGSMGGSMKLLDIRRIPASRSTARPWSRRPTARNSGLATRSSQVRRSRRRRRRTTPMRGRASSGSTCGRSR